MAKPSIGVLHRLAPAHRAATAEDVAGSLVALHATDPASVHLAVAARTVGAGLPVATIDRALYEDRTLVLVMGMRRTLWVVPVDLVPVVAGACGSAIAATERRKLVSAVESQQIASDGERFVATLEEATLEALAGRGEALTRELANDVPALKGTIRSGGRSKWAADVSLATRIVVLLTCEGRIVRTRPQGGWTSTRHRYALAPSSGPPMAAADAQAALARRWLARFGPVSADPVADLRWWAGWTAADTKRALTAAGEVPEGPTTEPDPWTALVPSLDPTTMGWKDRSWYLSDIGSRLFDQNGNAGPVIWFSGRVVGGWSQRSTGEVATRLLVDIGQDGAALVETEAARLEGWLRASGAVVKPRFPTPLQKEMS